MAGVDFGGMPERQRENPLWVAQTVVDTDDGLRAPMMSTVAEHLERLEATATLTPALRALASTPNRAGIVLTLNYDLLIERAAAQAGREVQTLGVSDVPRLLIDGLQEPGETLRVVHLHGSLRDPPSDLVLDAASYSERAGDQRVRNLFGTLLAYYNLCVIGSSFEEPYLATVLQALRPTEPRHVIVCDASVADRIIEGAAQLSTTAHNVLICDYPRGDHATLNGFCEELIHCPPEPPPDAPVLIQRAATLDALYEPRRFVDTGDRSWADGGIDIALAFGTVDTFDEDDLRAQPRAVLVGDPGAGKSRLLEHLAGSPAQGERGVLVRLRNVRDTVGEPARLIERWVAAGEVVDDGPPLRTDAILSGDVRVHLLLDGLDELPRERRGQLADAIVAVGQALPDQRMLVSSRPGAVLEAFPSEWRSLTLVCDSAWREGLLVRAGTTEKQLAEDLGEPYRAVEPLLRVPFFLRGLLELLAEDHIPEDALGLVLGLLRRQLNEDEQLRPFGPAVERWLTRVAVATLLNSASTVSTDALTELADGLELDDAPTLAELLASRSLLLESAGRYSFQHRLIAEALMAEFLLDECPDDWLDVLAPSVAGYSLLREDYQAVATMLLGRSADWRAALARRDPHAAARATPLSGPEPERRDAAWFLWDRAQRLDIWIDPMRTDASRGDGDVVSTLIRAGGLADLRRRVHDSVTHGSRFQRGNAIEVLADARIPGAERLLRRVLVDDDDGVLRRTAAGAARRLNLKALLAPIERRALIAEDESEATDLGWAALTLAPAAERLALAVRLQENPHGAMSEWSLIGALSPAEQLSWLSIRARNSSEMGSAAAGAERLEPLLLSLGSPTKRQATQVALIAAVAHLATPAVLEFLRSHPDGAVGLLDAIDEDLVAPYEVAELLRAVGRDALERHGATSEMLDVFEERAERPRWRPTVARLATATEETQTGPAALEEILAMPRPRALQELGRLATGASEAPREDTERLEQELDAVWGERDLREAIEVRGTEATVRGWADAVLRLGPALHWRLSDERWAQAALCQWLYQPQLAWLAAQADPGRGARAAAAAPGARALADLLAICAPEDLASVVGEVLARNRGEIPEIKLEGIARRIAEVEPELLAPLGEHEPALAPLVAPRLAAAGDLSAQRDLLEALIGTLEEGARPRAQDLEWLAAVNDQGLFEPLRRAIALAGGEPTRPTSLDQDLLTPLQAAAERADPLATIALYDQNIAEPPWLGAQFVIYRREALVQQLLVEPGRVNARLAAERLGLPVTVE